MPTIEVDPTKRFTLFEQCATCRGTGRVAPPAGVLRSGSDACPVCAARAREGWTGPPGDVRVFATLRELADYARGAAAGGE